MLMLCKMITLFCCLLRHAVTVLHIVHNYRQTGRYCSLYRASSSLAWIELALSLSRDALFFFFFFSHLTYSRWTSSLPSCLWSRRIFPSLPGSRLTIFLSRCNFSTLTTRQPMVEFYLLTFPRFPLRKKEHKSYFGKNRTHDFRTSRCAAYLLDHSGDYPALDRQLCYGPYTSRNCKPLEPIPLSGAAAGVKENLNASRPSEHPLVRGGNVPFHLSSPPSSGLSESHQSCPKLSKTYKRARGNPVGSQPTQAALP